MSNNIVVNELLAFLQQKLDVMDELSALQICTSSFSEEDIAAAKLLLFEVLNKRDQMVSRRRDGTKKSVQDIISLFKETDPDDVPTFVARDLNKLPPVTFDHVDATSLLKDIVLLKKSLKEVHEKLDASQNTVSELRKEVDELRKNGAVTRSPVSVTHVNSPRGAVLNNSFASAVLSQSPSPRAPLVDSVPRASRTAAAPLRAAARPTLLAPPPLPAASVPASALVVSKPKVPNDDDDEGFVKVQKKRRPRPIMNRCGTAPTDSSQGVRAATPNTPVYISRLHYTVGTKDIVEYVRRKLGCTLRVHMLESHRNVNFKAFVVRVPNSYLPRVMDESFWPKDVVFRRFRGQIPQEQTKTKV